MFIALTGCGVCCKVTLSDHGHMERGAPSGLLHLPCLKQERDTYPWTLIHGNELNMANPRFGLLQLPALKCAHIYQWAR